MHTVKSLVYQRVIYINPANWLLVLGLGGAMIAGTIAGKRLVERLSPERFRRFVVGLLVVIAFQMLIFG